MSLRPAQVDDAAGIARVHVRAWQEAYREIVPSEYLNSLSIEERAASWRRYLADGPPEVWVTEDAPAIVGWIAFGRSRDADAGPETGEVEALYVQPEYWSTGRGRALWRKAEGRLSERGFRRVTLWVLAENRRAIRFYCAAGFAPALEREIVIGGRRLAEVRYEMRIG